MKPTICNNKKQLIKKIESGQDSLINPVANCYVFKKTKMWLCLTTTTATGRRHLQKKKQPYLKEEKFCSTKQNIFWSGH